MEYPVLNDWIRPAAALLLVVGLTIAVATDDPPRFIDEAGVRTDLPLEVGPWRGEQILYCQNPEHQAVFARSDVTGNTCPDCGAPLDGGSLIERTILPKDTIIVKYRYQHPTAPSLIVSVVLSGRDRSSLHRPQMCLVGNGNEIVRSTPVKVPRDAERPLTVMVLDMLTRGVNRAGQPVQHTSYFAYWLAGQGLTTHSHLQRMAWMAMERVFKNQSRRWAYVSIAGPRNPATTDHLALMSGFAADFYPLVTRDTTRNPHEEAAR
jgi:hypothetical protein